MAGQSGILIKLFTPEEDAEIIKHYRSMGTRALAKLLNRSKNSVISRAHRLGVARSAREMEEERRINGYYRTQMAKIGTPEKDHLVVERPIGFANKVSRVRLLPQKPPEETVTPLNGVGVKIWELDSTHCRWVMGDSKDMTFCGHGKWHNTQYCAAHYEKSVVKK
jgi:hypothetical protein